MRSLQSTLSIIAYCLTIALCVGVAGMQMASLGRRFAARTTVPEQVSVPAFGSVDIVYFSEPTCPACRIASPAFTKLQRQYPQYRFARVDTSTAAGIALQEEYNQAFHVPQKDRNKIPAAFAGGRFFVGVPAITDQLPAYLKSKPLVQVAKQVNKPESGEAVLARRFRLMSAFPVIVAGLMDSINPCAITTLVFFLSYLTLGGRRPQDLLWIGGMFTLGCFLTYSLIGFGLLQALHSLKAIPLLGRLLYPAAALTTLILAIVSFADYRKARRGDTSALALQLPHRFKLRIHEIIRTRMKLQHLALAAFGTAVLVSGLEFTCTSQVYLPTLMYMVQAGEERLRAMAFLLLYNLMFVLPLIVLFVAAYLGMRVRDMVKLAHRHTASVKLAMSVLFVGFTVYLCTVSVRMLGHG